MTYVCHDGGWWTTVQMLLHVHRGGPPLSPANSCSGLAGYSVTYTYVHVHTCTYDSRLCAHCEQPEHDHGSVKFWNVQVQGLIVISDPSQTRPVTPRGSVLLAVDRWSKPDLKERLSAFKILIKLLTKRTKTSTYMDI